MNRAALVLMLVCCAAVFAEGCGSARKARKERRLEAARRADSTKLARFQTDTALSRADTSRVERPSSDTIETAALDAAKYPALTYVLSQHGLPRPFRTMSGKFKLDYQSEDRSFDATVTVRVRRDSAIWASVTAVGGLVPVARVLVTPDSVLYINYLQREAARMAAADASSLLPLQLNFAQLQAVLLAETQAPRAEIVASGLSTNGEVYIISTRTTDATYTSYYSTVYTTLVAEGSTAYAAPADRERMPGPRMQATVQYKDYFEKGITPFPRTRNINLAIAVPDSNAFAHHTITLTFDDLPRFDIPLEFSFSIPKNYTLK